MIARCETLGQDLKAWAAEQLHVSAESTPAQVRAAYLRAVQPENGAANLSAREALLILTGRINAARPALALDAVENKLQREVDDFASRFFAMGITERKAEWEGLKARGQGLVRVDARLAALRRGLYFVRPDFKNDTNKGLVAKAVCELFVLRPTMRAARRLEILRQARREGSWTFFWAKAAKALRQSQPAVAALDPELIARLADSNVLTKAKFQLARKMSQTAQAVEPKKGYSWVYIVFICAFFLLRACVSTSGPTQKRPEMQPLPQIPRGILDKPRKPDAAFDENANEAKATREIIERTFGKETAEKLLSPETPKDKQAP